jgi:transposase InsO family protein
VRYQFIKEQHGRFPVAVLCRALQVSQSGYFAWLRRTPSRRSREETHLLVQIRAVYQQSDKSYGSPRIQRDLAAQGVVCSRKRVERIMRKYQVRVEPARRFVTTTDSAHALPVAPNLLDRQFGAESANQRWCADITYVWTGEGWLYLSVVLDLFSRRIVGWATATSLDRALVIEALKGALLQRRPDAQLLCHSDRGFQYASLEYQALLGRSGIACSMSRRGNCWDNAPVESFFASLKREMVHRYQFATRPEARQALFSWIEIWYNRKRRHSALGYLSPQEFEQRQNAGQGVLPMAA